VNSFGPLAAAAAAAVAIFLDSLPTSPTEHHAFGGRLCKA
jgi:hypothetical protein